MLIRFLKSIIYISLMLFNSTYAEIVSREQFYDPQEEIGSNETRSTIVNIERTTNIDSFITAQMNIYHIPGVTAAIVKNNDIIWTGSYGFANLADSVAMSDSTLFYIASVSKTVTGVALMKLWEAGLFDLDDNINDSLSFVVENPNYPRDQISFRMLLAHVSSIINNWEEMPWYVGDSPIPLGEYLPDYLVPGGAYYNADENYSLFAPGSQYEYTNIGYALIGGLVEQLTGNFSTFCQDSIFAPLGMNETAWFFEELNPDHIAMPYYYEGGYQYNRGHYGYSHYPAGQLRTSSPQLSRFLIAFMQGGIIDTVRILDSETVSLMKTVQYPNLASNVGLGWNYQYIGGRQVWGHGGGQYGSKTRMFFNPADSLGVIFLTNGGNNGFQTSMLDALFDYGEEIELESSTIIQVPGDYSSIQEGLNAASEGDTVMVAAGTYYENIIWPGTNGIKLIGSGEEDCIIDGDSLGSVMRFEEDLGGIIDSTTHITGFTLQNGYAYGDEANLQHGGGIYLFESSPTLTNMTITSNRSDLGSGGGIFCENSSPILSNVTISNNHLVNSFGSGGGIYCINSSPVLRGVIITGNSGSLEVVGGGMGMSNSSPILLDVIITGNSAGGGGGLFCDSNSNPSLTNVTITDNNLVIGAYNGGGGILMFWSNAVLTNVTISDNSTTNDGASGGGISCWLSNPTLTNVTISGNSSNYGGGIHCENSNLVLTDVTISGNIADYGGGIYCVYESNTILTNSVLWDNSPQEVYLAEWGDPNSILIAYSNIEGGLDSIYTSENDTVFWAAGNINAEPLFVDPDNNEFSLQAGSPCVDAGTAWFVSEDDTLVNIPDSLYNGNAPDMGALESPYTVSILDELVLPAKFSLHQNYPNPFNPVTIIQYELPKRSDVQITIFDMLGREVVSLVSETQDAGYKSIVWNAANISSGIYFYQIRVYDPDAFGAGDPSTSSGHRFVKTKKLILLK